MSVFQNVEFYEPIQHSSRTNIVQYTINSLEEFAQTNYRGRKPNMNINNSLEP